MELIFEADSLIDKNRKTFFILPSMITSYTSAGSNRRFTIMFAWLCWGTSVQIMWQKGGAK
jgi:hypothetical protein